MHELSIAMSILEMAEEESEKHGGTTVEAIYIKIGAMSGIVAEALTSAYELAREQTPFENCRLVIENVPIAIYCAKCQAERPVQSLQWFCCAECGTPSTEVLRGRELQVSALELAS
jgi:hydrogenase nickel incorporation protein HypA/HybF